MEALWLRTAVRELARWHSGHVHKLHLGGLGFAGLDPGQGPTHCSSGPAVVVSHIQNEGRLARMLAVSSVTIFHTKKKKKKKNCCQVRLLFSPSEISIVAWFPHFLTKGIPRKILHTPASTHTHTALTAASARAQGPLPSPAHLQGALGKGTVNSRR